MYMHMHAAVDRSFSETLYNTASSVMLNVPFWPEIG